MRKVILIFSVLLMILLTYHPVYAQGGDKSSQPDDEFNIFLLFFATAFICVVFGAAIIGAFAATLVVLFLFILVSAGVLSTSILIGVYRKSVSTGFRTFLIILSMIAGTILGTGGLWLINKLFELHLSNQIALIAGAISGCIGGVLMGFVIFKALQLLTIYFKNKLKLSV